jgi:hypothetical protein
MRVDVSTRLACSAAKAWDEVQKSALLLHVALPLARIEPADAQVFPERWSQGLTVRCKIAIFGFIPIGIRNLHFAEINAATHEIITHEYDPLVKSWDHTISIKSAGNDQAIYRDVIEIDAGLLTVFVWAWTNWFYRHRQVR